MQCSASCKQTSLAMQSTRQETHTCCTSTHTHTSKAARLLQDRQLAAPAAAGGHTGMAAGRLHCRGMGQPQHCLACAYSCVGQGLLNAHAPPPLPPPGCRATPATAPACVCLCADFFHTAADCRRHPLCVQSCHTRGGAACTTPVSQDSSRPDQEARLLMGAQHEQGSCTPALLAVQGGRARPAPPACDAALPCHAEKETC